ncbi:DUF4113 domain-containing protein [Rhodocytophaga aerolata]
MDSLNQRYGKGTLTHASSTIKQSWQMLPKICFLHAIQRFERIY